MSVRWNSEFITAMEHRDLQANAMAVNHTGTYVLLAGRRYIAIRNLDDTDTDNIKKFPRQSKYDVGSAEWNHTGYHSELCVISSNQRLEILTWRSGELTQTHSLRAHTRVITDLNWHRTDPNLLASCSVDTFIHLWDLRDTRRPTCSLSAIAEASQVRWNYVNPYLLATAHDGDIKLWDNRKGTAPILYVSAHLAKIHGLDWNPTITTQLATSSQDNTVKFFDINNPRRAEYVLNTNAPVWRARFTPFGNGMVTVVVPQLRRGENSLLLWNTANRASPVHTFVGHRDVVLEFEWCKQKPGDTDFQLVTWSKDQSLLVWRIEPFLQKLCGHEPEENKEIESEDIVEAVETSSSKGGQKFHILQQEFSLLNVQIQNLEVVKMDVIKRMCTVRANTGNYLVLLQVNFPNAYPHGVPPTFQVVQGSSVEETISTKLLHTLTHIAQQRVLKNRTCLEPCLRQLVSTLEQLAADSNDKSLYDRNFLESPNNIYTSYNDAYIPFPRTSGAKFCSVSTLVCFGRPMQTRRLSTKVESSTPRALSALGNMFGKRTSDQLSISSFYYPKQRTTRNKHLNQKGLKAVVVLYDASGLFFNSKQLASQYILDGDTSSICKYNANVAAQVGRWDLVQAWTLAELAATPQQHDDEDSAGHPFGNHLMQSLIDHYASHSDIQMAAMLTCVFGKDHDSINKKHCLKSLLSPTTGGGSPYHTIPPPDIVEGWVFPLLRTNRSTSLDNIRTEKLVQSPTAKPNNFSLYEYYKLAYAEMLHRWDLLYNRAEVLKHMCTPNEVYKGVQFLTDCQHCGNPSKNCSCSGCKKLSLNCVICHVSVRGSANCCLVCGHGGHTKHMQQWFEKYKICPSGCGCQCLYETASVLST